MRISTLLGVGIVAKVVATLCCFTPLRVVLPTAVGVSRVLGWIDDVLMPALVLFIWLRVYVLWKRQIATSN